MPFFLITFPGSTNNREAYIEAKDKASAAAESVSKNILTRDDFFDNPSIIAITKEEFEIGTGQMRIDTSVVPIVSSNPRKKKTEDYEKQN